MYNIQQHLTDTPPPAHCNVTITISVIDLLVDQQHVLVEQ